jgi:hypothetical protein
MAIILSTLSYKEQNMCAQIVELVRKIESGHGEIDIRIKVQNHEPERLIRLHGEESIKL